MAMERTTVDGRVLNVRTANMLKLWQFNALTDYYLLQGSYNAGGVKQSAGTHDGGGALDTSVYGLGTLEDKRWHVKQGRLAGFMAYYRPTLPGKWREHIHAGALGDPEASRGLEDQFEEYREGGDGLVGGAKDPGPRIKIRVYPNVRLKRISGLVAWRQFTVAKPKSKMTVRRIQWVLNEKLGTNLVCDGVAGPKTRTAYKAWEKKINAPVADGVPGKFSLNKLGEGRFVVKWLAYEKNRKASGPLYKAMAEADDIVSPVFPKQ